MGENKTRRMNHSQQGLHPSHGRLLWTHWSHACLLVVAREALAVPLRRVPVRGSGFSFAWHLLTCRERRSLYKMGVNGQS